MSSTSSSRCEPSPCRNCPWRARHACALRPRRRSCHRPVPSRDRWPHQSGGGDAPRLDGLHPMEVGVLPVLGHEHGAAALHRVDGRLRQGLGVDIPLVGEERLDDDIRAVAVRHGVDVRLDLFDQPRSFELRNDGLARGEAIQTVQFLNCLSPARSTWLNTLDESALRSSRSFPSGSGC